MKNILCPCGSGKKYKKCCFVYHKGKYPNDAISLMKSRYSAFAVGDIRYIIDTSTFQNDFEDLKDFCDSCEFRKLDILDYGNDSVTFKATIFCNNIDNSFVEISSFVKVDGKWKYDSGKIIG
jgi:SEC-C motif-containing protein